MTEPDTRTGFNLFRQETQGKGAQALSREPLAKIGARFAGRYHITEELGRGAMGVVYRAADLRGDGYVAIKVVPLGEDEATARFVRGTKIMLRLKRILQRALARRRGERYRSALELGRDLREVLEAAARPTGPMSVATV